MVMLPAGRCQLHSVTVDGYASDGLLDDAVRYTDHAYNARRLKIATSIESLGFISSRAWQS